MRPLAILSILFVAAGCGSNTNKGNDLQDAGWQDAGVDAQQTDAQIDAAIESDAQTTACEPAQQDFWVYDLSVMPPKYVQTPATCRAAGAHGMIYVADDVWNQPVTQGDVDGLLHAFDTPAMHTKGMFQPDSPTPTATVASTGVLYYVFDLSSVAADSTADVTVDTTAWQDMRVRVAAYPDGAKDQASVFDATREQAQSVVTVPNVGGSVDRLVLVLASTASTEASVQSVTLSIE